MALAGREKKTDDKSKRWKGSERGGGWRGVIVVEK